MLEKLRMRWYRYQRNLKKDNTLRVTVCAFLAIILVGVLLLMLPCASRDGRCCGFMTALFTATSATCVTGLIMVDTWTQWTGFGQVVILLMIQIGGLGFMSCICFVLMLLRRRMGMRQRMILAQSLNLQNLDGMRTLLRRVLLGTAILEGGGAVILTARFCVDYSFPQALARGVFHAVSAFCNAGFDLLGNQKAFGSMAPYATDPIIMLTLSILIVTGGLGFFVWDDIIRARSFRRLSVYSRLVLISTAALLLGGIAVTLALEWRNPATLGPMNPARKLLVAFFQSVTLRTAGFAAIDQAALTESTKLLSCLIMLVGGSSGSTAGGIKTVTVTLLLLSAWSAYRGRSRVVICGRRIPAEQVVSALSIVSMITGLAMLGGILLSLLNDLPLLDCLYEASSAIATVGLTTGITPQLNTVSHLLLICYMFFGRVGLMTISLAFLMRADAEERIGYPETRLMIG